MFGILEPRAPAYTLRPPTSGAISRFKRVLPRSADQRVKPCILNRQHSFCMLYFWRFLPPGAKWSRLCFGARCLQAGGIAARALRLAAGQQPAETRARGMAMPRAR
eukprot:6208271-Pyramimonas_sp.AAC.1